MANEDYLDLLMRALNGELSDEVLYRNARISRALSSGCEGSLEFSIEICRELFRQANVKFESQLKSVGKSAQEVLDLDEGGLFEYLNWMSPIASPHTMVGRANLDNLRLCLEDTLKNEIPGDFIETGVWKGGLTVLMRGVLKAYGCRDRRVWVADSFAGLPQPDPASHLKDALFWDLMAPLQYLAIPFEYTQELFRRYDLLDEQVCFLKGWFCDTLPSAPIERLAVARLDGDLYESTRDALVHLYPKLSQGGYLIIDDYGVPCGCRQAVEEYRAQHKIREPMQHVTEASVYWQKMTV